MSNKKSSSRRIRYQCARSVPKDAETPNEDSYQLSRRLNVYTVCDGASISYDSALWSRIVARRFCMDKSLDRSWLLGCIDEFNSKHDRESLSWAKQAAFDRGSFTSLLGVVIDHESSELRICAIGDSVAVLCNGSRIVSSCPYNSPSQFDDSPSLLSTIPDLNSFDKEGRLICTRQTWSLLGMRNPVLFSMTDALAKWFLESLENGRRPSKVLRALCSEGGKGTFTRFVWTERADARLRRDDTTVLAFW
jgi:hypothetical protein